MTKRIIHFMGMGAGKYGGLERYMVEFSKQAYENGFQTIIVYEGIWDINQYIEDLSQNNVIIEYLNLRKKSIRTIFFVYKLIHKYKPEIIQCHFAGKLIVISISWLLHVKSRYCYFHNMLTDENDQIAENRNQISFKTLIVYKLIHFFSTHLLMVSDSVNNQIKNLFNFNSKVFTIRLGVGSFYFNRDFSKLKYSMPQNKIIIGNVSQHARFKGLDVLINALSIIIRKNKFSNIILFQIGGYPEEETILLKKLCTSLNIENYVKWMGIRSDALEIMAGFDIYCQPSRSEGLPLTLMEACALNLPIVATNVAGNPEIILDGFNGLLVNPEDPEELADKLFLMIQNKNMRINMANNCKSIVLNYFDLKTQVSKLLDIYQNH